MGSYVPTRCWAGDKLIDLRVRKRAGETYDDRVKRAARQSPIRATHFAIRVHSEWRIYTTGEHRREGARFTYTGPRHVLTPATVEAAEMWLMHRGWDYG